MMMMFVTLFFIISQWADWTLRKLVHVAYIYTLWFGKLKVFFFLPKWQESHLNQMGLTVDILDWVLGGVPGYLRWRVGVGFSGSKNLGLGIQRWPGLTDAVWYKQWNCSSSITASRRGCLATAIGYKVAKLSLGISEKLPRNCTKCLQCVDKERKHC